MNKEGKEHLRNELMQELWRMNKMDIIVHLMEIIEGETAVLGYLARCNGKLVNPSMISEELNISRARTANILRSLRKKELIVMEIDDDDRRKMQVGLTEKGRNFFAEKFERFGFGGKPARPAFLLASVEIVNDPALAVFLGKFLWEGRRSVLHTKSFPVKIALW